MGLLKSTSFAEGWVSLKEELNATYLAAHPEALWTCHGASASDATPEEAHIADLVMCQQFALRDVEGRVVRFCMPPALAVAIARAILSGDAEAWLLDNSP